MYETVKDLVVAIRKREFTPELFERVKAELAKKDIFRTIRKSVDESIYKEFDKEYCLYFRPQDASLLAEEPETEKKEDKGPKKKKEKVNSSYTNANIRYLVFGAGNDQYSEWVTPLHVNGFWEIYNNTLIRCTFKRDKEGKESEEREAILPQFLLPIERLLDIKTGRISVRLKYSINIGSSEIVWHERIFEKGTLSSNQKIIELSNYGIEVNSNNAKAVASFLSDVETTNIDRIPMKQVTASFGWIGENCKTFVPFAESPSFYALGDEEQKIFKAVEEHGNREAWLQAVRQAAGNKITRIFISAAASSLLIQPLGLLPYVVHIWGKSGTAKTVAMMVCASLFGKPENGSMIVSLNSTQNALLERAALLNCFPMLGDEYQTTEASQFRGNSDSLIYQFTEGVNRGRLRQDGTAQQGKTWHNCLLTTGEQPLIRQDSKQGSRNRTIELKAGTSLIQDGHTTAETVRKNYGFGSRPFIEYTIANIEGIKEHYFAQKQALDNSGITEKQSVAAACIITADWILEEISIYVKEPKGTAIVETLLNFLRREKDIDIAKDAYESTMNWITSNFSSFYLDPNSNKKTFGAIQQNGYALVYTDTLRNFFTSELHIDFEAVKTEWAERGWLAKTSQDRYIHSTKVHGGKATVFKIKYEQGASKEC